MPDDETRDIREEPYKVGNKHPPLEARFKPGNQASKGISEGKGCSIITQVKRLLKEIDPETGNPRKREAAMALLQQFLKGNPAAIKEIMGRIDGPIPTEITGGKGGPVSIIVKYADKSKEE